MRGPYCDHYRWFFFPYHSISLEGQTNSNDNHSITTEHPEPINITFPTLMTTSILIIPWHPWAAWSPHFCLSGKPHFLFLNQSQEGSTGSILFCLCDNFALGILLSSLLWHFYWDYSKDKYLGQLSFNREYSLSTHADRTLCETVEK